MSPAASLIKMIKQQTATIAFVKTYQLFIDNVLSPKNFASFQKNSPTAVLFEKYIVLIVSFFTCH